MTEWIDAKTNPPPDLEDVVFYYTIGDHKRDVVCGHIQNGIWNICYLYNSLPLNDLVKVTHWMKQPEYPK